MIVQLFVFTQNKNKPKNCLELMREDLTTLRATVWATASAAPCPLPAG